VVPRFSFARFVVCAALGAGAVHARPLNVVATLPAILAWAAEVGGPDVTVSAVPANGASPHDYQPRPSDSRRLASADVVLMVAEPIDGWVTKTARAAGLGAKPLVALWNLEARTNAPAGVDAANPHFWLDPAVAAVVVNHIGAVFAEAAPDKAADFRSRADADENALAALDDELRGILAPVKGRTVVCHHDAFAYFLNRYGIPVAGVLSEGPDRAPGPRRISALVTAAKSASARAVLITPGDDRRLAARVAADLGVPLVELDAMEAGEAAPGRYAETMRDNARRLAKALL
jgi:ABC-type Zn uptake system ZnuABC Zn-binding protein ZnuA